MLHAGAYAVCQLSPPRKPASRPTSATRSSDGIAGPSENETRSASQKGGRGVLTRRAKEVVTPSATSAGKARRPEVVDLRDGVGNRVNVVFADRLVIRTAVNVAPKSELVTTCMSTLSLVLPAPLRRSLISRMLDGPSETLSGVSSNRSSEGDEEWEVFAGLLQSWARGVVGLTPEPVAGQKDMKSVKRGAESRKKGTSSGSRRSSDEEPKSDWEFLLQSDLYTRTLEGASYGALELPRLLHEEVKHVHILCMTNASAEKILAVQFTQHSI
jgi:hypothetical protein